MVIAVADVFDAITTERIYQRSRSLTEGFDILIQEKGKQFDERTVDIFIGKYASRRK